MCVRLGEVVFVEVLGESMWTWCSSGGWWLWFVVELSGGSRLWVLSLWLMSMVLGVLFDGLEFVVYMGTLLLLELGMGVAIR